MNFKPGCARSLYHRGIHPRVLLGPDDLPTLRKLARSGDGRKIMTALRARVGKLVKVALDSKDLAELLAWKSRNWRDPGILIQHDLHEIALVAVLDEDPDALEATRRVFDVIVHPKDKPIGADSSSLAYDVAYHHLSEETRQAYRALMTQIIRQKLTEWSPKIYKGAAGNIALGLTLAALDLLLAIKNDPGVPNLDAEQAELVRIFEAVLHVAINPDGYPEEDIGYGSSVTSYLSVLAESLRRAGIYDAYKECPRYARFGQAMLHFVQPWGKHLSNTGDHGDDFGQRDFVLARLAKETRDPSLLWLLGTLEMSYQNVRKPDDAPSYYEDVSLRPGFGTMVAAYSLILSRDLKGAVHPSRTKRPTQYRDRGRGIVSFRSSWDKDATFVVFDGSQRSPGGQGHFHSSCGHFSLSALGEYFAIDTGRYNIEQNCHNVVLIDGKSGRSTNGEWDYAKHDGRLIDYVPGNFCDYAAVDSSHQHNSYWARRHLGLVKGEDAPSYVWTVEDINKANDWAEFWFQIHTSPENVITLSPPPSPGLSPKERGTNLSRKAPPISSPLGGEDKGEGNSPSASIQGWRHGNHLDVHFALPAPDAYPKPHVISFAQDETIGSSTKYVANPHKRVKDYVRPSDMVHYSLFVRPRLLAKVGGYNGKFMSVMIPRRNGDSPAKVERLRSLDNSLAMKLTFPKVEDTVIFAYEHNLLEAGDVKARGQWCVVRRSRRNGRVLDCAMGHALNTPDFRPNKNRPLIPN